MDPQVYYEGLIAKGYSPDAAAKLVQSQFPNWTPASGSADTGIPSNPDDPADSISAQPSPTDGTTDGTGGIQTAATLNDELIRLLNSKNMEPGAFPTGLFDTVAGRYGLAQGQQGFPDYRADTKTISVAGGYLLKENGVWRFQPTSPEGGTGSGGFDANGFQVDPSYLQPFGSQDYLNTTFGNQPPQFQAPGDFRAPTAESILSDPSYQFRRDQSVDVLQKTKAAQGLYHSGGTIYDLANLASNFAGTEYSNIWNRDFNKWATDWQNALSTNSANVLDFQNARDTYWSNQSNPFQKLRDIYQIGANAAGNAG